MHTPGKYPRSSHERGSRPARTGLDDEAAAVASLLAAAPGARSDPAATEAAVTEALALAPENFEARLAAYRFYFFDHRFAEALPHAAALVVAMARRLNVATDWRQVRPADAEFSAVEEAPSLYLQALVAFGYGNLRLGRTAEGIEALEKVKDLDPTDRFAARRLLALVAAGAPGDDD